MKKMTALKKLLALFMTLTLVVMCCACGNSAEEGTANSKTDSSLSETVDLRLDVVSTGTQAIPAYVIQKLELDKKYGFNLVVHESSGSWGAEWTAMKTDEVDGCITNWIDVGRNSSDITVKCVAPMFGWGNSVLVPSDSKVSSLEDLKGLKLGVYQTTALDWIILRAAAKEKYGFDPADENEVQEAAAGLLMGLIEQGEVDTILSYADTNIQQASSGDYKILFNCGDCLDMLGLNKETPFLFYTFTEDYYNDHPETVKAFVSAYEEAIDYLMENDDIWSDIGKDCFEITSENGAATLRDTIREVLLKENTSETEQQCVDLLNWCIDNGYEDLIGIKELPKNFVVTY